MLFMELKDVQCIVSPANSFGLMNGGYEMAIIDYFGKSLRNEAQKYIINNYNGEQPVGTAFIIDIPNTNKKLIHTPIRIKLTQNFFYSFFLKN